VNSCNSLSLFFHVWQQYKKIVKGNWILVNTENITLTNKSVFFLKRTRKHFSFLSLHTFFSSHVLFLFIRSSNKYLSTNPNLSTKP
jgi:hypothetical protein